MKVGDVTFEDGELTLKLRNEDAQCSHVLNAQEGPFRIETTHFYDQKSVVIKVERVPPTARVNSKCLETVEKLVNDELNYFLRHPDMVDLIERDKKEGRA